MIVCTYQYTDNFKNRTAAFILGEANTSNFIGIYFGELSVDELLIIPHHRGQRHK
jgi:hypothetical protein